jgi:hypothetical protein
VILLPVVIVTQNEMADKSEYQGNSPLHRNFICVQLAL